ncbi:pentatricopeptide repeat-containing protein chloroplastic [Dorcoceras hygrometricum]|uniref:Pentatricopeptide repeat-containing protein chloroplastic n=1 Tax=Dorcoceras hygrometricum TaxID=472368 RepID=A0A2Z7BTF6_9LAMI|nr:pentatricopeptide repeat-containing protein chloroplastic [Dorcoceras hygrometricum]
MAGTPLEGPPPGPDAPPGRAMGCNACTSRAKIHPRTARRPIQQVDLGLTKAAEPPPLIHGPPSEHLDSNPSPMNRPRPKHLKKQFKYKDARASGNTALSSPCWDLLATMRRVVNYHSSWARQRPVELFDASGCEGERQYRTLISLLGSLATMRRVVNYHSSWARQRHVEWFDASGNPGFTAGRGFNPAGGSPGGG